ncbi:MAG TPA: arginase family protein [Anaerolineales bacterium]|nr:arginase family protein [Anaerolineales bacterium]
MNIQIIQVPYDSGHKSIRAGQGPQHFLERGLDRTLLGAGHQVDVSSIASKAPVTTEVGTALELSRLLAEQVRSATNNKKFPIVLSGNCNSCLGTITGIGQDRLGILWFDAHGDFNTPETTLSGFFDGMGLAIATGRCWQAMLGTVPGFQPIPEANVIHIGGRDLDPEEEKLLRHSEVTVIQPGENTRARVDAALDHLRDKVTRLYLHVDIDILDTGEALPNRFAVPGGLSVETVEKIIRKAKEKFEVCAGAITSFEPSYDKDDKVLNAGIRIAQAFVA